MFNQYCNEIRTCYVIYFSGQGGAFVVAGKVESGHVQNGDKVLLMPAGEQGSIKGNITLISEFIQCHSQICKITIAKSTYT